MGLDRYEVQARLIADELLDILTDADRRTIQRLLEGDGDPFWDGLEDRQPVEDAIALLAATPAERAKRWKQIPAEDRPLLWIRARTMGLRSASVLRLVLDVQMVEGMKYRQAVQQTARSALLEPQWPQPEELLERAF